MYQPYYKIIIAIDGFSSCGKSTVAKAIAKLLNYAYIDTGAMYRCITLFALENRLINSTSIEAENLQTKMNEINISFRYDKEQDANVTFLNDQNVESKIRSLDVSNNVSRIAELKFVRERLVFLQQQMGEEKGIVMDGRDIGTVVFPNAELKIFMTADENVRAKRRHNEMVQNDPSITLENVKDNIRLRDHIDQSRQESPLRKANDAIVLDNSYMTRKEQLDWLINTIKERIN